MFGRIGDTLGRSASITLGTAIYASGLAISCYMRSSNWNPAGPVVGGAPLLGYVAGECCSGRGRECAMPCLCASVGTSTLCL